jgi:TRAP transporter TAXI family solute receptor
MSGFMKQQFGVKSKSSDQIRFKSPSGARRQKVLLGAAIWRWGSLFLVLVGTAMTSAGADEGSKYFVIGTGGTGGIYHVAGRAICDLVDRSRNDHGMRCSVEATPGSAYNINVVYSGEVEFGIVQADVQHDALAGEGQWLDEPFENLRAVFSLYPEFATLLAREDSGVEDLNSLKGNRVNIGTARSGTRTTWDSIEAFLGWSRDDLAVASGLLPAAAAKALCGNELDALFLLTGHPSSLIKNTMADCRARLVPIGRQKQAMERFLNDRPYFTYAAIPGKYYGFTDSVPTVAVRATVVVSAELDERLVYTVAKTVLSHVEYLQEFHPAFADLEAKTMITDGLTAPLHPGAVKAYRELGLIP